MKSKGLSFIVLGILSILLVAGFASSLSFSTTPQRLTLANNQTTITLSAGNDDVTINTLSLSPNPIVSGSASAFLSVIESLPFTISATTSKVITVSLNNVQNSFNFGEYTSTLTASGLNSSNSSISATTSITFLKSFCSAGPVGDNLSITNVDISSSGDEDLEWKALDIITVEVEVENTGDDTIEDVQVELGLFDSTGRNIVGDLDFINSDEETIDLGSIRDGKEEVVTFEFKVPADFDFGNYRLAVKAYSDDLREQNECTDTSEDLDDRFFQDIDVLEEDEEGKFIAFDNVELSSDRATCGDTIQLSFEVFNVGDEDQDQVRVNLVNKALNVDMFQEIKAGLDKGDSKELTFTFNVPQVSDKVYVLEIEAEYDYRSGVYRESSDDTFPVAITLIGCTPSSTSSRFATITASLDSEAKSGSELVVKSTITNVASEAKTMVISASGYESWASLDSISQRTLALNPGESKEITLNFNVDSSASGENSFTIEARSGESIESRDVSVNIAGSSASDFFKGSALIWIIAIVNIILIAVIIIVAVKMSQR